jgi:hypothetical protein
MTNGFDEEEEVEDVEEIEGDLDDDFGPDDDDEIGFDDFEGDFTEGSSGDASLTESKYEEAVRANPKRLTAAQRKKATSIIEGIIDDAELTHPEGQERAWQKLNHKIGVDHARKYSLKLEFTENDVIDHPKFGIGFVVELLNPKKIEVLFEDGLRRLACNMG